MNVKDDVDRVAVQRGPIVYCAEGADNDGRVLNLVLPDDAVHSCGATPRAAGRCNRSAGERPSAAAIGGRNARVAAGGHHLDSLLRLEPPRPERNDRLDAAYTRTGRHRASAHAGHQEPGQCIARQPARHAAGTERPGGPAAPTITSLPTLHLVGSSRHGRVGAVRFGRKTQSSQAWKCTGSTTPAAGNAVSHSPGG